MQKMKRGQDCPASLPRRLGLVIKAKGDVVRMAGEVVVRIVSKEKKACIAELS